MRAAQGEGAARPASQSLQFAQPRVGKLRRPCSRVGLEVGRFEGARSKHRLVLRIGIIRHL